MLTRIRTAVAAGASKGPIPPIPREYPTTGSLRPGSDEAVALLVDRLIDYKAEVSTVSAEGLADAVDAALGDAVSVVVPTGLHPDAKVGCERRHRAVHHDGVPAPLTAAELDAVDAVVTAATVAIAVTGTIVLDGSADQGRRAITLVPDVHVVILTVGQIVETVPEGLALLRPTAPLTLISGPSATSDIELSRVEGVHGPRTLRVLIVR